MLLPAPIGRSVRHTRWAWDERGLFIEIPERRTDQSLHVEEGAD
ncbi:MAG: hypothetical protein PUE03_03800 [Prevotella sp.]|nr:hypothetical protein [Prevotella sp.]